MSYDDVIRLKKDHPEWIIIVKECLEYVKTHTNNFFTGSSILNQIKSKLGTEKTLWFSGLRTLSAHGILEVMKTSRGGRRAYYRMLYPVGVERALKELGEL